MKEIHEIENIKDFTLEGENVFYIKDKVITRINLKSENSYEYRIDEFEANQIDIVNELIVLRDSRNFFQIFDKQSFNKVDNPIDNYRLSEVGFGLGKIYKRSIDPRPYGLFDFQRLNTIFESPNFITTQLDQSYSYYLGNNEFIIYDNNKGQLIHKSDVDINQFNRGFVYNLNSKEYIFKLKDSLYRYDIEKGITNSWSIYESKFPRNQTNGKVSFESEKMGNIYINIVKQKIIVVDFNVFSEIDLESNQLKSTSLFNKFKENQISGNWTKFIADHNNVYCISDQSGDWIENDNHLIFKMDLNTLEIMDKWQLPKINSIRRGFNINGFQSNTKYIGIMEQNKSLHIIEK